MICSRLASAVTISTGVLARVASARIALSRSMPGMPGMFQSVITRSNGPLRSSTSALVPSPASVGLKTRRSLSRFLTMRRMVEQSSTMRSSMFFSMRQARAGVREWGAAAQSDVLVELGFLAPVAQARAQAQHRLAVDLADPRLADRQHRADLAQVELLLVVQRQHQLLAFGQVADGAAERFAERGVLELARRRRVGGGRQPRLAVVLLQVRIQADQLAARGVLQHAVVLVERDLEPGGDLLRGGGTAGVLLDTAGGGDHVAVLAMDRARHPVATADLVDHRAADADAGVGLERRALVGLEIATGVDQAKHAGLDQVVDLDAGRQARGEVVGDAAHQLAVALDDERGVAGLVGAVGGCGGAHAAALRAGCAIRRSMKNSTWPRGPGGLCHWPARRAMSRNAAEAGADGNASTTASCRCTARRSHSSRGIAPR